MKKENLVSGVRCSDLIGSEDHEAENVLSAFARYDLQTGVRNTLEE
jgi:hypothetical protein